MTETFASQFFTISQYAQETTSGTPVAATKMAPAVSPKIVSDTKLEFPDEQFNVRMKSRRAVPYEVLYANSLSYPHAGFEQLLMPLQCGLMGLAAPTETTGSQGDYPWIWNPNLTAAAGLNNPKSATLEFGDNAQAYQVAYCMFDKITIKGSIPQDGGAAPVSIDASFFGRQLVTHAFTSALSLCAVQPMNAKLARLYVDTAWAGIGGTELPNLLRDFQIEIMTGLHPDFAGSSALTFAAHKESYIDYTATFTLEGGTTAHSLLALQQAAAFRACRLDINGPQIGTGTSHLARFDMGGILETVGPDDSADRGDNLSTVVLHGIYDTTGAKGIQAKVICHQNAI